MPTVLKRLSTVGAAAGAVLVMVAAPAGAGASSSLAATDAGSATQLAGVAQPGSIAEEAGPQATGPAAGSVGFRVYNLQCFARDVTFNADTFETGRSGVQRFRQQAQLQEFAGRWANRSAVSRVTSQKFPNNASSFHFDRHWDGSHANNGASWRVKWQGFYLNGGGGVIAKTKVITATCF